MNIGQKEQVAIVTGAGSGIGRALCEMLASEGFCVALVGRDESKLYDTVAVMRERNNEVDTLVFAADVSDELQCRAVVDQTVQRWRRIDVLVNNAAIPSIGPIDQLNEALLSRTFATNTFGPAYLISQAWPSFVSQRSGCVVNVSSMATVDPFPGLAAYAASKSALESLTRSVMNEGRQWRLRAFSIVFGAVETSMLRAVVSEEFLPRDKALHPSVAAQVILDCIQGRREGDVGRAIVVPGPELPSL